MTNKNRVSLVGNLGRNSEYLELANGSKVLNFSLATNHSYKDKNGITKEVSEWHTCCLFGNLSNAIKDKMIKGTQVAIEGELRYRVYLNKSGTEIRVAEIVVSTVLIISNLNQ